MANFSPPSDARVPGPADRISRIDFDEKGRLYALGAESHFVYRFVLD